MIRVPKLLGRSLLVVASLTTSVVVAEGLLRMVGYTYTPLRIQVLKRSEWRYFHAFKDRHFMYDPVLIWRPKPGYSIFNPQGYRGRELAPVKEPGETRIFAFGDSNTLGGAGEKGPNWPGYLDEIFRETDRHVTVINAGVWGYTAFQGLRRFKGALAYEPDMALISFGGNDAHRVAMSDAEFANRRISRTSWDQTLHKSRVGQLVLALADGWLLKGGEPLVPRVSLKEYEKDLEEMIKIGQERGIKMVLLTRPFIGESPDPLWWKNFGPAYNAATLEVGRRHGVPVIDVYSYFKDKPQYFSDESHFTAAGHRVMAEFVYKQIEPLLD